MSQYALMHKNDVCGSLIIDDETGALKIYKDNGSGLSPFLGNADTRRMKHWWEGRAVPASRKMMQEVLRQAGCTNTKMYLAKNLALSMTDSYWIRPLDMDLKYENVKLSNMNPFSNNKVPYHNATSYDANASLGGQMEKYWDIGTKTPTLIKESYKYFRQQAINEAFATHLHDLQETEISYVSYLVGHTEDNGLYCKCDAFTNDFVELVSAYEVIEGSKLQNDKSLYDNYIRICTELGIEEQQISNFMDYQTLTDFIISNSDEHLGNFGILRDVYHIYSNKNKLSIKGEIVMNDLERETIEKEAGVMTDDELKEELYKTVCDENYQNTVIRLLELNVDVEVRRQHAQYLSQKAEILEKICKERGIKLSDN